MDIIGPKSTMQEIIVGMLESGGAIAVTSLSFEGFEDSDFVFIAARGDYAKELVQKAIELGEAITERGDGSHTRMEYATDGNGKLLPLPDKKT